MDKQEYKKWHDILSYLKGSYEEKPFNRRIFFLICMGEEESRTEHRSELNENIMDIVNNFAERRYFPGLEGGDTLDGQMRHETKYGRDALNIEIEDWYKTHEVSWGCTIEEVIENMVKYKPFSFNHTFFVSLSFEEDADELLITGDTFALEQARRQILTGEDLFNY